MILDCHTHHPAPDAIAVISASPESFDPIPDQLYSVGLHPWHLESCLDGADIKEDLWRSMCETARHPQVAAIGECGIDLVKGPTLAVQMLAFRRQAELAEEIGKPLVIHCVRAHDMILGIGSEINPTQPWIIHGFRGKPTIARMLIAGGCSLSFGEKFNPESLAITPLERIFAETDESLIPIKKIIDALQASLPDSDISDLESRIAENGEIFRFH